MPLMYLCTFQSSSSEFVAYISPLCPLSNATSLTQSGFSKEELCEISHSDLLLDWFSRVNLYDVPQVTVSTFESENHPNETTARPISVPFYGISIQSSEREL